ncbi:MAG: hypothetical protein H0T84_12585, partial [Tatlockia sp.]|nr:hypothetical protein [Tatlockia sp.]
MSKINSPNNQDDKSHRRKEKLITDENIKGNLLHTKDCIIVFDEQGRLVLFNKAAANYFSCFTEKMIGEHMSKLVSLKTLTHKRLFSKTIKYFSLAAKGVPQQFQWVIDRHKKPIEAFTILFNVAFLNGSKVIITRVIDIMETKTMEWVLWSLAEISNRGGVTEVIDDLTKLAAQVFKTDYALVNLLDNANNAYTVSKFYKGKKQKNFSYSLADAPCELVKTRKKICQFNGNVSEKFPKCQFLEDWKIKSYRGGPLFNFEKKVVGLLILMSEDKIKINLLDKNMFRLFSDRISLEIERLLSDKKLQFLASFPEQDPNPILSIHPSGEVLYSNKAGSTILKYWSGLANKIPPKLLGA